MTSPKRHYRGIALDNDDGHTRRAEGEGFSIRGGSEETHDRLVRAFCKASEDMGRKGRKIQEGEPKEVFERVIENLEE